MLKPSSVRAILFGAILLTALACSGGRAREGGFAPMSTWVPPLKQSVYLRAIQDRDPSGNLGRFFAADVKASEIDESNASASRCSKHFTPEIVEASGSFDESFTASTSVGGSLSLPVYGGKVGGGYGSNGEVRVRYQLKKVMRAKVDTDGLEKCCAADPKACGVKYIAEFYLGDGEVYQFLGDQASVKASGAHAEIGGDLEFKNGTAWKRVNKIDNAYFAFKTGKMAMGGDSTAEVCSGDWVNAPPQSLDGQYFVGQSAPAGSKQAARDDALLNARTQTMQFIATKLSDARVKVSRDLDKMLTTGAAVAAASEGLAKLTKDRCWKVGEVAGPTTRYEANVLVFFPNTEIAAAAKAVAGSLKAAGVITGPDADAIKAGAAKVPGSRGM